MRRREARVKAVTEGLYARVARTGGLPEIDGPERRDLLRQAAIEAARAAMPRLGEGQRRILAQALLKPEQRKRGDHDRLLGGAILLWCEARWDGAAPIPRDERAAALLESIAADRLPASPPTASRPWIAWVGPIMILLAVTVAIGVQQHKTDQRRAEREASVRAAALAAKAEVKLPPMPALLPVYTPDPLAEVRHEMADQFRRDRERLEQQQMMEEFQKLRADLYYERTLRDLDRRYDRFGRDD